MQKKHARNTKTRNKRNVSLMSVENKLTPNGDTHLFEQITTQTHTHTPFSKSILLEKKAPQKKQEDPKRKQ